MKILVTIPKGSIRDSFFTPDVMEQIYQLGEITFNDTYENYTANELCEKLIDVDICITGWGNACFNSDVLKKANKLKLVAHSGGTVAPIVSKALYDKGVKVISANKVFAESVAESVIAYALSSLRDIPRYSSNMQKGGWQEASYYNEGLLDQTIGLVGFGQIPKYLVAMLKPFRTKIKAFDKYVSKEKMEEYGVKKAELDDIFTTCHIISVHLPRTADTFHIINEQLLHSISDNTIFINTARGSVIDEQALIKELALNRFKAVLDVYEQEPLPEENPLRKMENVILLPHMGGPTIDRRKHAIFALFDDIKRFSHNEDLVNAISYEQACLMTM